MTLSVERGGTGAWLAVLLPVALVGCGAEPDHAEAVSVERAAVGPTNHRPTIAWIRDLRATPGATVPTQSFRVGDDTTPATSLMVSAGSSNTVLLPLANITLGGSGANRTVRLQPVANVTGSATVTVTVNDGTKTAAGSFTLTVAANVAGNAPPAIQGVANEVIAMNGSYGPVTFVVMDPDGEEGQSPFALSASSTDTTLVPASGITFGRQNRGRTVTARPSANRTGRATITLRATDGTNTTSTSFVLDVVSANTPPAIAALPTFQTTTRGQTPAAVNFTLTDTETPLADLRVTATSSNTTLLPGTSLAIRGTGANRTLTIAGPANTAGASTITLAVSDGDSVRRSTLLHVVVDPTAPAARFDRPRGVFALDGGTPATHRTPWGADVELRDRNIRNLSHVSGYALRVAWADLENPRDPNVQGDHEETYDFFPIENVIRNLPAGQRLSLIITPGEPAYIAERPEVTTWGSPARAVPWDPTLRERRRTFLRVLAAHEIDGVPLARHPALSIVNPYLPGGHTGLRDPLPEGTLSAMPGYSRAALLAAAQDELLTLQNEFPGNFVQIGFWPIPDWEWLEARLLAEFDGVARPRVGFYMENLAASRLGPGVDPFTGFPVTGFAAPLHAARNATWNSFQMLGSWTRPFQDDHTVRTLNGTPADALEYAYTAGLYGAEYYEVYVDDIDNPAFQRGLQSWHDFFESRANPSGHSASNSRTP